MNVFSYAAFEEAKFENQLRENGMGYKRLTTFFSDLSIAEFYGIDSIRETYDSVIKHWLSSYKMFTEFVICLNYKCWEWYEKGNEQLSRLYAEYYYDAVNRFFTKWDSNEEACSYYYAVTD